MVSWMLFLSIFDFFDCWTKITQKYSPSTPSLCLFLYLKALRAEFKFVIYLIILLWYSEQVSIAYNDLSASFRTKCLTVVRTTDVQWIVEIMKDRNGFSNRQWYSINHRFRFYNNETPFFHLLNIVLSKTMAILVFLCMCVKKRARGLMYRIRYENTWIWCFRQRNRNGNRSFIEFKKCIS